MTGEYRTTTRIPDLRQPVLVAAFAGWNDASQVATYALTRMLMTLDGTQFASIDPEPFFDFTETRPSIVFGPRGKRQLQWPTNTFFAQRLPRSRRDAILLIGNEPQLKWRTFVQQIMDIATETSASRLVTVGGLLADVPHTIEPRLTGFGYPGRMGTALHQLGVETSTYQGPTGIIGVLHETWRARGKPAISLWGSVPHYISASPNPAVSLALLRRLEALLHTPLHLKPLELEAASFLDRIEEALGDNPEAREYVTQLEAQAAGEGPAPSPELIQDLEHFLRSRREPPEHGK
ncbi:MAG: PAC2 family protein [Chloroflexota bacterium]